MSLKENLENFLEHYDNMTDLSSSLDGSDSFELEFLHLKQISQRYRTEKVYPTSAGESDVNMRKNRYKDILPFDHSRFLLSQIENVEGSDYINANYLKGVSNDHSYLAAQGPLPHTVNDFWRMLWESNTQIIVMACNEFEQGRHKCERYWVDDGEEHSFGDIVVTQITQRRVTKDFMIRTLKATRETDWTRIDHGSDKNVMDKESKIFNQFHYTAWPDHGVPTSVKPILDMIKLVREYQQAEDPPILVHCSAGCGRTGTICVIDYVRNALQLEKIDQNFSLYDIIVEMRKQRHAIVQTRNQYELVHRAVVDMFQSHLGIKPEDFGHNYENVQLKHERFDHVEQPRMPPRVPGQTGGAEKRDSASHNYVNINVSSTGAIESPEIPMPRLPSGPTKSSKGSDSPDGTIYANCDVRAGSGDSGKQTQDASQHSSSKQTSQPKSRPSPDDRYKNNFKATLSAFKDFELDVGPPQTSPPSPTPSSSQNKPKPTQAIKPAAQGKPQIAGKPKTKPSPPVKPSSVDVNTKPGSEKLGNGEFVKTVATRQNSNPVGKPAHVKDASHSAAKRDALKLPVKPARLLEKSKSEGDGMGSPGVRQGLGKPFLKGAKGDRPAQPPPKPPTASSKPPLQRANGEDKPSGKGRHDYEEVHISPPADKGKETTELTSSKNLRGSPTQQMDSFDAKDSGIVRRKTDSSSRKLSSGSIGSDSRSSRKNSEEYAYVQQPTSIIDKLLKSEEAAASPKPAGSMYAEAYSEVPNSPVKPGQRMSTSSKEYSYVDTSKIIPPEKPKRGESVSGGNGDGAYDLVGIPSNDSTFDSFMDSDSLYSPTGESIDMDDDIPVVPARTAQSYQLVDEEEKEEKTSGSGKMNKMKARFANSRDIIGENKGKIVNNTKGLFKRLGGALKPELSHTAPSPETDTAKPSNINDLLEKTLLDYKPAYKEGPVSYKDQEIGFPKRIGNPKRPRSPPSSWGITSAHQVRL
ncbi:uncharacterized protein LOC121411167 isoform X1 [Lytechinus variegatus]|uniref:uncharacterized protein LOC121411167 isoform X1 n=1 Tax=Lytechinus variegatus TaxID=7654 RepID=UPI001BB22B4D|nr:uncharacterized protein LOC121411167 isoform X1 [Lytechinus variegatus]